MMPIALSFSGTCRQRKKDIHCCVFPFRYRGLSYNSCTTITHTHPWCVITPNYRQDRKWGNCACKFITFLSLPIFPNNGLISSQISLGKIFVLAGIGKIFFFIKQYVKCLCKRKRLNCAYFSYLYSSPRFIKPFLSSFLRRGLLQSHLDCTLGKKCAQAG